MPLRTMTAALLGGAALLRALTAAPADAQGAPNDIASCIAMHGEAAYHGCFSNTVLPNNGGTARIQITWDLWAENYDPSTWRGGIWMYQTAIAGQHKKYPKTGASFPANTSHEECNEPFLASKCHRLFSGAKGSLVLEFPYSMAGYQYELYSHDWACSTDGEGCGYSGGSVQSNGAYGMLWLYKGYRWTEKVGAVKYGRTCPPAKQRKGACTNAAIPVLNSNPGGGYPVEERL